MSELSKYVPRITRYTIAIILLAIIIWTSIFASNFIKPFRLSFSFDHQGNVVRQAWFWGIDNVRSTNYEIRSDWLGRKYAIYKKGPRFFLQKKSGEVAVEIMD